MKGEETRSGAGRGATTRRLNGRKRGCAALQLGVDVSLAVCGGVEARGR